MQSTAHQNDLLRADPPVPEPDTDKDRQEDLSSMPEQHFHLRIVSESHPGRKRPNNEDHFAVDESRGIIVLADGMGGHRSGEVASERTRYRLNFSNWWAPLTSFGTSKRHSSD